MWFLGVGNLLNAILDPILIFLCGLGVGGAAMSTVISEYVVDVVKLILYLHHTKHNMITQTSLVIFRFFVYVYQVLDSRNSSMEAE